MSANPMRENTLNRSLAFLLILPWMLWSIPSSPKTGPFPDKSDRRSRDSTQYILGELHILEEAYDMALGNNLAIALPVSGAFRDSVLVQRARIFGRVWTASDPSGKEDDGTAEPGPTLAWGIGSGHERGFHRAGPAFPYGKDGMGFHTRTWMLNTHASLACPMSFHGQDMSFAAEADLSPSGTPGTRLDYDLTLRGYLFDLFLENLTVTGAAGVRKTSESKPITSLSLSTSRLWPSENGSFTVQGGFAGEWSGNGGAFGRSFWMGFSREAYLDGENFLSFSLEGAVQSLDANANRLQVPVLFVDDVTGSRPTHYQGPDFRDSLPNEDTDVFQLYAYQSGELPLDLNSARSRFSVAPSVAYGMALPAGWQAIAAARYGVDVYPESAWDQVTGPASIDPVYGDFNGLALNRADGRLYAAVMLEEDGGVREFYGTDPMERRETQRVDQTAGLDLSAARYFGGQTISVGAYAERAWSNLSGTAPVVFRPWHWGVTVGWTRTWGLP
jgi:hypothetical protein